MIIAELIQTNGMEHNTVKQEDCFFSRESLCVVLKEAKLGLNLNKTIRKAFFIFGD
jgi:hypothetical protein